MDRLRERLAIARKALGTFQAVASGPHTDALMRDGAIKRFEYSYEVTWKAAQRFLQDNEARDAGSPKSCVRLCREEGILSNEDAEAALRMAEDRNLTAHTYHEALAKDLAVRLPAHAALMDRWLSAMESRLEPPREG